MSSDIPTPYPLPELNPATRGFWEGCQQQTLNVYACAGCGHLFLPGAPNCPRCWSADIGLKPVSGRGEVFSFVVYRRTYHPAIAAPYVVALIQLDEGPRLISNIVGCSPEAVGIGLAVEVCFEPQDGFMLPRFKPR